MRNPPFGGRGSLLVAALALSLGGCQQFLAFFKGGSKGGGNVSPAEKPINVKSFSETTSVTAVQPVANALYVGTSRGLIKWDVAKSTFTILTAQNGLPG